MREPARIVKNHDSPRPYIIEDSMGEILRRNSLYVHGSVELEEEGNESEINLGENNCNDDSVSGCARTGNQSNVSNEKVTRNGRLVKPPSNFKIMLYSCLFPYMAFRGVMISM